jgi:opacity protein-like surface antigen
MSLKSSPIGIKSVFMAVMVLPVLIPIHVFAENPFYIALKPGFYSPQSSDLHDIDTRFSGEMALGYRFHPNLAAEVGVGYLYSEGELTVVEADYHVYPVTFTLKAIFPYKKWEVFGLGGAGIYFVSAELGDDIEGATLSVDTKDDDAILGGYLGAGIHYNITPRFFVGAEVKHLWTEKVKLEDVISGVRSRVRFNINGYIAAGVLGIRF